MAQYINLLPKEEQKEISLEKVATQVVNLLMWIVLSMAATAAVFFGVRVYLNAELRHLDTKIELQRQIVSQQENKELKNRLTQVNTYLSNLTKLNSNHAVWSEVMVEFARLVPPDLSIDSVVADRTTGKIRISGFARSRESVLLLRENILHSDFFKNIDFPLSNLTRPVDLDFHYTFFVKQEELIEK